MSETKSAREDLAKYCEGIGVDLGFGGSAITDTAITMDRHKPYCPSLEGHRQILRGDARDLSFICDNALDFVYSSHLLEDFLWVQLPAILQEWRRVLRVGGRLVICCPDEKVYREHCAQTNQPYNHNHKNFDFCLAQFKRRVLANSGGDWDIEMEKPLVNTYSWYLVAVKK